MVATEPRPLVERAVEGDECAFEALYREHAVLVYNLALRSSRNPSDAEDICQEVWVRVHRDLHSLRTPEAFPGWLRRIATHVCVDAARRRRPSAPLLQTIAAEPGEGPEQSATADEERRLVWEALSALPPRQSAALFLREVEGYEYRRIAETIEASVSGVETLLFRARRSLAKSYALIEGSRQERCRNARSMMSVLIDGEGSPVERRSLDAHVAGCAACRQALQSMRRVSEAYAALPLVPIGGASLFGAAHVGHTAPLGLSKLAMLIARLKALLAPAIVATSLGAGAITLPLVIGPLVSPATPERISATSLDQAPAGAGLTAAREPDGPRQVSLVPTAANQPAVSVGDASQAVATSLLAPLFASRPASRTGAGGDNPSASTDAGTVAAASAQVDAAGSGVGSALLPLPSLGSVIDPLLDNPAVGVLNGTLDSALAVTPLAPVVTDVAAAISNDATAIGNGVASAPVVAGLLPPAASSPGIVPPLPGVVSSPLQALPLRQPLVTPGALPLVSPQGPAAPVTRPVASPSGLVSGLSQLGSSVPGLGQSQTQAPLLPGLLPLQH